jgi:hypothetical protein
MTSPFKAESKSKRSSTFTLTSYPHNVSKDNFTYLYLRKQQIKSTPNFSVGHIKQKDYKTHNNLRDLRTESAAQGSLDSPSPDRSTFHFDRANAFKTALRLKKPRRFSFLYTAT